MFNETIKQAIVVAQNKINKNRRTEALALFNADGTPFPGVQLSAEQLAALASDEELAQAILDASGDFISQIEFDADQIYTWTAEDVDHEDGYFGSGLSVIEIDFTPQRTGMVYLKPDPTGSSTGYMEYYVWKTSEAPTVGEEDLDSGNEMANLYSDGSGGWVSFNAGTAYRIHVTSWEDEVGFTVNLNNVYSAISALDPMEDFPMPPPPFGMVLWVLEDGSIALGPTLDPLTKWSGSISSGQNSFAAGNNNEASGSQSAVLAGSYNTAAGDKAAVLNGTDNAASGNSSAALGSGSVASGTASHASGYHSEAAAQYSHAEGAHSKTAATATGAHAEGGYADAYAAYSHVQGGAMGMWDSGAINQYQRIIMTQNAGALGGYPLMQTGDGSPGVQLKMGRIYAARMMMVSWFDDTHIAHFEASGLFNCIDLTAEDGAGSGAVSMNTTPTAVLKTSGSSEDLPTFGMTAAGVLTVATPNAATRSTCVVELVEMGPF